MFQGVPGPVEAVCARWGRVQPASGGQTGRRAQQIVESQQQRQSLPVLVLAAVADLVIAEVPFHGAKRMLHLGPQ